VKKRVKRGGGKLIAGKGNLQITEVGGDWAYPRRRIDEEKSFGKENLKRREQPFAEPTQVLGVLRFPTL